MDAASVAQSGMASLKTTVDAPTKKRFDAIATELGLSASAALAVFVKRFVADGGFPFDVRTSRTRINFDNPTLMTARVADGAVIAPPEWWEDDDE